MHHIRFPELYDEEWLRREYEHEQRSLGDIARELGCSHASVMKAMDRFAIERRPQQPRRPSPSIVGTTAIASVERAAKALPVPRCRCPRPMPGSEGCEKCGKPLPAAEAA